MIIAARKITTIATDIVTAIQIIIKIKLIRIVIVIFTVFVVVIVVIETAMLQILFSLTIIHPFYNLTGYSMMRRVSFQQASIIARMGKYYYQMQIAIVIVVVVTLLGATNSRMKMMMLTIKG